MADIDKTLARFKALEVEKEPWLIHLQALSDIFLTRKSDFTQDHTPGEFLNDEVFDNTGQFAAQLMGSVFLSMLWPDSARTFEVKPVRRLKDIPEVEEYFQFVTEEMRTAMDRPEAGLNSALMEHFQDQGVFGTSGIATFEGPEDDPTTPVVFEAWDIKGMYISQNAQGRVDTIYLKMKRTVRQIVEEYSTPGDKVSAGVLELHKGGKLEEKIDVLKVIEPKRPERGKSGVAGMKMRTAHIDMKHKVIMREGGFEEMPVAVGRMFKRTDETYGRSAAMMAMPDAVSLNALSEAVLVATEKQLDPPLGVLDDGRLGGGVIDTSAGALNVFHASGQINSNQPIFPLFTVGELQSAEKLEERLIGKIMQAFFLDRLLDLNNTVQMTAFETSIRNRMRGESLGAVFSRQETEVLTPTIQRVFNIMWRRGALGNEAGIGARLRQMWDKITGTDAIVVPEAVREAVAAGLDVYTIEYISPSKRFMQAEKLQGIFTATDALAALSVIIPGISDNIHPDKTARAIVKLSGSPSEILRTPKEVADVRQAQASEQEAVDALEAAKSSSETARNVAQARATLGTAGGAQNR